MRWTPRVTVAAVIENQGRFLVLEESENSAQQGPTVINQPAGHLEDGESLLAAVIRETLEETAWRFTPEAITGIYRWVHPDKGHTYLRVTYTGSVSDHDPLLTLDTGILRTHWLSREELLERSLRSPMVMRCIDDYLAGHRYALSLCDDVI
ncbi:MAG: NUDIX hydrolase [Ectothiorhodospiraceae bacterium]|nr:NUDIX hydrolase [Ectothiorhodospiraceae bacterium]